MGTRLLESDLRLNHRWDSFPPVLDVKMRPLLNIRLRGQKISITGYKGNL